MDFSAALTLLKDGKRVARTGWNGKGMWVELRRPLDGSSTTTLPWFVYYPGFYPGDAKQSFGASVAWLPSQADLFAEDWILVLPDPEPAVTLVEAVASLVKSVRINVDAKPTACDILRVVARHLDEQRYDMAAGLLREEAKR